MAESAAPRSMPNTPWTLPIPAIFTAPEEEAPEEEAAMRSVTVRVTAATVPERTSPPSPRPRNREIAEAEPLADESEERTAKLERTVETPETAWATAEPADTP